MAAIAWPSISLAIGLAGGMTLILLMMRYLPDLPMFRAFILNTASGPMPPVDTAASPDAIGIGHSGTATTDLRPAGKAQIGPRDHSVVTRGEFIEAGARIRVIEIGSFRTVVEKIDKEP
jgi:membrane-bound serine protease (ClpP class)